MSTTSLSERAKKFFVYGHDAVRKGNYDYAIQMYRDACRLEPVNLSFRQSLRAAQRLKYDNDPAKVGRLASAKTHSHKSKARAAKAKDQWIQAFEHLEDAFAINPWDVSACIEASEAAVELKAPLMAKWLMESVLNQGKEDIAFLRQLALVYKANNDFEHAIQCLELIRRVKPNEDIIREIKDTMAEQAIGKTEASSGVMRSLAAMALGKGEPIPEPKDLPKEAENLRGEAVHRTPEEHLAADIERQPASVGPYLRAAEHYKTKGNLEEAEKMLARGLKAVPGDPLLMKDHADIQLIRIRKLADGWKRRLKANPADVTAKTNHEKLIQLLIDFEVKEWTRRLGLEPGNAEIQLELGKALARANRHDEAIKAFQSARNASQCKVEALRCAGASFEAKGMLKLAERNYQDALKAVDADETELLKAIHYRLGRIAEEQNNVKTAEEHFTEVANMDFDYLDVAARLQNLNS